MQFNNVTISGNLVGDAELEMTKTGIEVCKFRIANNMGKKDNQKTAFLDVSVYGAAGSNARNWLTKGDEVLVSGPLSIEEWKTKDGEPRKTVAVNCNTVQFVKCKAFESNESNEQYKVHAETPREETPF